MRRLLPCTAWKTLLLNCDAGYWSTASWLSSETVSDMGLSS